MHYQVSAMILAQASDVGNKLCRSINAELTHISQQQDRDKITRTVHANQDQGDVLQRYRKIESLFRQLQVSTRQFMARVEVQQISRATLVFEHWNMQENCLRWDDLTKH